MGYDIYITGKDQDGNDIIHKELSVSWNHNEQYVKHTGQTLKELLYGKKCSDTTGMLSDLISKLGVERGSDAWQQTAGNAGAIANTLLGFALIYPDAYWDVI